jgi:hypothetical protein
MLDKLMNDPLKEVDGLLEAAKDLDRKRSKQITVSEIIHVEDNSSTGEFWSCDIEVKDQEQWYSVSIMASTHEKCKELVSKIMRDLL